MKTKMKKWEKVLFWVLLSPIGLFVALMILAAIFGPSPMLFCSAREALKAYERVIEINGLVLIDDLGRYEEALKAYERAIEINPNDAKAWNRKGHALEDLRRYQEALKSYDRAIEINPNYAKAWYNKGYLLDDLGRNEEALNAYERAIEINGLVLIDGSALNPTRQKEGS